MHTVTMYEVARSRGLAVGLVVDPAADEGECWLATVGLDCSGVGECPDEALLRALSELVDGPEPCLHGLPRSCTTCEAATYCTPSAFAPEPAVRWERSAVAP